MTEEAKAARRIYEREWRARNPEKVRARTERYWTRKAQELKQKNEVKTNAEENKE